MGFPFSCSLWFYVHLFQRYQGDFVVCNVLDLFLSGCCNCIAVRYNFYWFEHCQQLWIHTAEIAVNLAELIWCNVPLGLCCPPFAFWLIAVQVLSYCTCGIPVITIRHLLNPVQIFVAVCGHDSQQSSFLSFVYSGNCFKDCLAVCRIYIYSPVRLWLIWRSVESCKFSSCRYVLG